MSRIGHILGLMTFLGSLGPWGPQQALAQRPIPRNAERERFLELLLRRQDQTVARLLVRQKEQIDAQLARLERVTPRSPQQARQIERLEQQLVQRAQNVERQIANPPPSPIRRLLERQAQTLRLRAQQIETRLVWLSRLVPLDPRRARQIERVIGIWQWQFLQTTQQLQFLDRLVATPFTPLDVAGVPGLQARGPVMPQLWGGLALGRP